MSEILLEIHKMKSVLFLILNIYNSFSNNVIFCLSLQKFAIEQKLFLPHCLTYPVNTNGETVTIFRFGSWKCARYLFWIGSWTGAVGIVLNGNYFVISWILDSFFVVVGLGFRCFFR